MLDLDFIRQNPDRVKKAIRDKNEKADIDSILKMDVTRRQLIQQIDQLRHERKQASEKIARLKKEKKDASDLIQSTKTVGGQIKELEKKLKELNSRFQEQLSWVPNVPAEDVPVGNEKANVEVRQWGQPAKFDFKPLTHWDLGRQLDILDLERATKISGTGFMMLKGAGAQLERALINFMLEIHTGKHGYREISLPFLVNRASMFTTGQLPKLSDDMYRTTEDDFWLIPTGEVPLTNVFQGEVIDRKKLPLNYVAATACFRREAGSYGRETRGINRVHQFTKVELVKFTEPATSFDELEKLTGQVEAILQALGLSYRVIKLATGELSFAGAKTYDLEAWAPGLGRYLEVSSCSNFTDFQARRGNIKFRDQDKKLKFVHTLNGSGLALPRTLICLMETYQQADGSIIIPEVLRPYLGGREMIKS